MLASFYTIACDKCKEKTPFDTLNMITEYGCYDYCDLNGDSRLDYLCEILLYSYKDSCEENYIHFSLEETMMYMEFLIKHLKCPLYITHVLEMGEALHYDLFRSKFCKIDFTSINDNTLDDIIKSRISSETDRCSKATRSLDELHKGIKATKDTIYKLEKTQVPFLVEKRENLRNKSDELKDIIDNSQIFIERKKELESFDNLKQENNELRRRLSDEYIEMERQKANKMREIKIKLKVDEIIKENQKLIKNKACLIKEKNLFRRKLDESREKVDDLRKRLYLCESRKNKGEK